jgi:integrase
MIGGTAGWAEHRKARNAWQAQVIADDGDIATISKRLGHAKPSITVAIYAHMFHTDDSNAAAPINAALRVS